MINVALGILTGNKFPIRYDYHSTTVYLLVVPVVPQYVPDYHSRSLHSAVTRLNLT